LHKFEEKEEGGGALNNVQNLFLEEDIFGVQDNSELPA
jgi:hypothetical protein